MEEQNKVINDAIEEIKGADKTQLKEIIEKWFESTRTEGMKLGARFISAAVAGIMEKHLIKGKEASRRDLERCITDIKKVIFVQLTQQNDLEENTEDDGATEEIS